MNAFEYNLTEKMVEQLGSHDGRKVYARAVFNEEMRQGVKWKALGDKCFEINDWSSVLEVVDECHDGKKTTNDQTKCWRTGIRRASERVVEDEKQITTTFFTLKFPKGDDGLKHATLEEVKQVRAKAKPKANGGRPTSEDKGSDDTPTEESGEKPSFEDALRKLIEEYGVTVDAALEVLTKLTDSLIESEKKEAA